MFACETFVRFICLITSVLSFGVAKKSEETFEYPFHGSVTVDILEEFIHEYAIDWMTTKNNSNTEWFTRKPFEPMKESSLKSSSVYKSWFSWSRKDFVKHHAARQT